MQNEIRPWKIITTLLVFSPKKKTEITCFNICLRKKLFRYPGIALSWQSSVTSIIISENAHNLCIPCLQSKGPGNLLGAAANNPCPNNNAKEIDESGNVLHSMENLTTGIVIKWRNIYFLKAMVLLYSIVPK